MMTRKDYVTTSEILREYREEIPAETFADLISDFAMMFESDNPRFDFARFQSACLGEN